MKFAHMCERKGATVKCVMEKIIETSTAVQEVLQEVERLRNHSTILQGPPAHDHQANDAAQENMGLVRTMQIGFEARPVQDRARVGDSSVDQQIHTRADK